MARQALFLYGSLRDEALLSLVLGRPSEELATEPASLPDHEIRAVAGEGFPCAVPAPGADAPGVLLRGATEAEVARVRFFEDEDEFVLRPREVRTARGRETALVCEPVGRTLPAGPWRFERWPEVERVHLRECAREVMALYERGVDWSDPLLWPGIRARAAARAAAAAEPARPGIDGGRVSGRDVETRALARPYAGFFAVEEREVVHPTFDGGRSAPVRRLVWASGDAVTVLPYDPARDAVLLVAQWRAGPHARGDAHPWPVEAIAGRIEGPERPEDAARREAREEAGLELGRMERAAGFYSSPGTVAEFVTAFVAEADLGGAGGTGGLAAEHEDVLSAVLSFDEAMAMADRAEIDAAPALVSLLWLARHRARLRAEWAAAAAPPRRLARGRVAE